MPNIILKEIVNGRQGVSSNAAALSAVTLSTSVFTEVGVIRGLNGRTGLATIELLVGTQPLSNLKLTGSNRSGAHVTDDYAGGTQLDLMSDADFAVANSLLDFVVPTLSFPVAVGTRIILRLRLDGLDELGIYARTSTTGGTLQITELDLPTD